MKCPRCNHEVPYAKTCAYCKVDMYLFTKTSVLSNAFYNRALKHAKQNEISFAIKHLKHSLHLNKSNTTARNLLGLLYYEIGMIGDALKHWVISSSFNRNNNLAACYVEYAQQNTKLLDRYNDAIKNYNTALQYIRQDNDDMGIIHLKKSVELNEKFLLALNLLTLCYIKHENKYLASETITQVLKVDKANHFALRYEKMICVGDETKRKPKRNFVSVFNFSQLITFATGIAFGVVILYVLVYPTQVNSKQAQITQLERDLDILQVNFDSISSKYNTEVVSLRNENDKLNHDNIEINQRIIQIETEETLAQVENLYTQNKIKEAANKLITLNDVSSSQAINLKNKIYPRAAKLYYNNGVSLYDNKKYETARSEFDRALQFADDTLQPKIYYQLGLICEAQNDLIGAKNFYDKIINDFPNSSLIRTINKRLSNLKGEE